MEKITIKRSELRRIIFEESEKIRIGKRLASINEQFELDINRFKDEQSNKLTLWMNPKFDKEFKEILGVNFPNFPEHGDITFDNKKVGHVDNFSGYVFTDLDFIVKNKEKLEEAINKCEAGTWY